MHNPRPEQNGGAKFDKTLKRMVVTLPVMPELIPDLPVRVVPEVVEESEEETEVAEEEEEPEVEPELPVAAAPKVAAAPAAPPLVIEAGAAFVPAPSFRGAQRGYVFSTRAEGTGYYLDAGAAPQSAAALAVAAEEEAATARAAAVAVEPVEEPAKLPKGIDGFANTIMLELD